MAVQYWRQPESIVTASGTAIASTTTETILVPNVTLPAGFMYPGRTIKYTLYGEAGFVVTTPGSLTFRLRWNGVAGTVLAASGAFAPDPTAALASRSWKVEFVTTCRSAGTAGSLFTMGNMQINDFDDATVTTIINNLNMSVIPANTPAVVGSIDTTASVPLSVTAQCGVATAGTTVQCHLAILESLS